MRSSWRTNQEISAIYERHADTVYRVCVLFFHGRRADVEDAMQNTFLKLMRDGTRFESEEHEKAWLIVTAGNVCRNMLDTAWHQRVDMDERRVEAEPAGDVETDELLERVMQLPDRLKTAIYLFYYEDCTCREIARAMGKSEQSVWGYLHAGRRLLKTELKEEQNA